MSKKIISLTVFSAVICAVALSAGWYFIKGAMWELFEDYAVCRYGTVAEGEVFTSAFEGGAFAVFIWLLYAILVALAVTLLTKKIASKL